MDGPIIDYYVIFVIVFWIAANFCIWGKILKFFVVSDNFLVVHKILDLVTLVSETKNQNQNSIFNPNFDIRQPAKMTWCTHLFLWDIFISISNYIHQLFQNNGLHCE